ncbi:MAG: hypothetical protein HN368_19350 [Spirochaetales bacterium]|nr:hypothetical protein [Spirochaetales bacterium]
METALSFQEPDRVPIEIAVTDTVRQFPGARRLIDLVDTYSDNFKGIEGFDWGFFGSRCETKKETLGSRDGRSRERIVHSTSTAKFVGMLERDELNPSYQHWEKYFIDCPDDLIRLSRCEFPEIAIDAGYLNTLESVCGDRYVPIIGLMHPLGHLARMSPPTEFYLWLTTHSAELHQLFEKQYDQLESLVHRLAAPYMFSFTAYEMALPPWMSREMFDDFIRPYDTKLNGVIHRYGGRVRHHVHGCVGDFLDLWVEMGMDSLEPLERPPFGDSDIGAVKKRLGKSMSLAGNLPSQMFINMELSDIENMVKETIDAAAAGGGFLLRCASLVAGLNSFKTLEQLEKMILAVECFIESGLTYGQ